MHRRLLVIGLVLAALATPARAAPMGEVAAVQVGLRTLHLYRGTVDGQFGPGTATALRAFQRREGLAVDGIPGPRTRSALQQRMEGRLAVAALQFRLAQHGFPSGPFDGRHGPRTASAVRGFQRFAGLPQDGVAGRATLAALLGPPPSCPLALRLPVDAPAGDGFGPRGGRFHTGVDFAAPTGAPVLSAAAGTVTFAGLRPGGWGITVVVAHGSGVRTLYAHLSAANAVVGQRVAAGTRIGAVGATGNAQGPHLHFEVRLRGAAVDPAPAFRTGP